MNKRLWFVLLSTLILGTLFTFNSCQIGLGASVDVESPVVEITYPPASAVIKGTFTFAGTCSDDKGVTSAKVTVTNSDNDKSYGTYDATVASDGSSWSVSLNAASTAEGSVNGWSYPDGSYEISIVAYDGVGHSSGVSSRAFEIDNTAPVLILSKPLAYGSATPTKFGRTLKIAGDIGEQHTVGTPVVHVYQYANSKLTKTTDLSVSNFSTMSSDNPLIIAKYYTTDEIAAQTNTSTKAEMQNLRDAYLSIYGSEADNATTSDKTYYCGIELFDNARTYVDPSDSGTGKGNASTEYYINADGFNSALLSDKSEYKLTVRKLMNILNGTDSEFTPEQKVAIKSILNTAGNFASSTSVSATASSTFSVNPANNPTWKINDYAIGETNNTKATSQDHRDYALGSTIYLSLSSGRDGIYLKPSTVSVQLQQYTYTVNNGKLEWAKLGEPITILKAGSWTEDADTSATYSFAFTSDYKDVDGNDCKFASGKYYSFIVNGEDRDQNTLSPENNYDYGLLIKSSHNPPEVDFLTQAGVNYLADDVYYSADAATGSTYLVGATIPVRVHTDGLGMSGTNPLSVSFPDGSGITYDTAYVSQDGNYYYYTITITGAGTPSSTSDKLKYSFTATATDADSGTGKGNAYFNIDDKKPTVNLTTVSPYVSEVSSVKTVNGKVTFGGTVSETNKPTAKKVTYTVTEVGASAPAITDTVAIQDDDTFSFELDTKALITATTLSDKKQYVVATSMKDIVGNSSTISSKTIYIDESTDLPVITLTAPADTSLTTADSVTATSGLFMSSETLKGTLTDDDGIKSFTITIDGNATTTTLGSVKSYSLSKALSGLSEGTHSIIISVTDTEYETTKSSDTFYIGIDNTVPEIVVTTNSNKYYNSTFSYAGKVKDGYKLKTDPVTVDGTKVTTCATTTDGSGDYATYYSWSQSVAVPSVSTKVEKTIVAMDYFGRTASATFSYIFDLDKPTVAIGTIDDNGNGNTISGVTYFNKTNRLVVTGTAGDTGNALYQSGVSSITWGLASSANAAIGSVTTWNTIAAGSSWTINTDLSSKTDGAYTLWIKVTDAVGNSATASQNLYAIGTAPTLTETTIGSESAYQKGTFSIGGAVATDNMLSLTYTLNGGASTAVSGWAAGTGTWSITNTNPANATFAYIVTATNKAKMTTTVKRTITIDTVKPTITWTSPTANHYYNSKTQTFTGGASDALSGLKSIQVKYASGDAYTDLATSTTWLATNTFTTEGSKTIYLKVTDNAGNENEETRAFYIDTTAPVIDSVTASPATVNNNTTGNVTITATNVTDTLDSLYDVASVAVYEGSTSIGNMTRSGTTTTWTLSTAASGLAEGSHTYTVTATDKAGNVSASKTVIVSVDKTLPTMTISSVTPTVSGKMNGTVTVAAVAKDETKLASYSWSIYDGTTLVSTTGASGGETITDTYKSISFTIDTTILTKATGTYTLKMTAVDAAGNTSTVAAYTLPVDQSTDTPVISLSNAKTTITANTINKTNGNLFNTSDNNKLLGAVSDDDGIQSITVAATDLGTNSAVTMTQPTFTAGSTTASLSCVLPSAEGKYKVVFTVIDTKYADTTDTTVKALRTSTATYYVAVDKGAPTFSISTASGAYTAASTAKSVTGTASDSNGIYSIIRYSDSTYSTIETSWINGTSNSITYNTTSGAWTDTIAAATVGTAGATKYYEAADVYGNTTRLEFTYKVDALSPTFTITQLGSTTVNLTGGSSTADANYALSENVYQVKGTVTDPGTSDVSGVKGIYYYIVPTGSAPTGATAYAPVTGSTTNTGWNVCSTTIGNSSITWTANISLDGVADSAGNAITEGTTYVVYIAAVDEAGNVSVIASNPSKVVQIIPDANVPSTTLKVKSGTLYSADGKTAVATGGTITTDSTYYASGEVKIEGTITETNFDSTYYAVTKNSAPASGQVTTDSTISGAGPWSFTRTAAANNTDDGTYAYALGIYDKAGRSNVYSFTIIVDTKVPTLEVTSPAINEAVAVATKNLKGTASDSGSGIKAVTYTLYAADGTTIIQNNLSNITGDAVLTGESWAVSSMPLGSSEGSLKLKVVATDNLSHSTTTWVPFYYDKSNPELYETTVGDSGKILNTSTVTLGGTASDTNALVGSGENAVVVTETVSGATTTVATVDVTGTSWSASLADVSNGKHTYTVTATDAAGKTTSLSRVVTVDTTTPSVTKMTITNTNSATISSVDWYNVATITAHVVAADTGTGVASVEYSTDYTAASPSTATWNTMTNKSTYWTGNITCSEGTNKVYFRVTDVAGNTNTFTNSGNWLSFGVDTVSPAATLTSVDGAPLSGTKLVNGNNVVTVVMNATDSTTGIKSVALKTKIGASTASTSSPVTTGTSGSYTFTIAKADLGTGNAVFTVTDNAGNAADFNLFAMLLDNTAPTATINVPTDADTTAAGTQVNKTIILTGIAGDNQALADTTPITIEYQTGASTWATLGTPTGTTSWTLSSIDTASAFTTVYDSDGSTAGTQVSIRAKVTDKAGNTGYSTSVPLTVDQNSDRPVIKLSNILVAGTSKLKMSSTVYGTVTDDDGVSNFYYTTKSGVAPTASATEDPTTGWTTIPLSSGTWNVSSGSDGTTTLYFKVVDAAGTTFTTNNSTSLTRPYTIDSAITKSDASSDNTTGIKFQSDSSAPVIVNTTTDKWGIFSSKTKYTTSDATAVKGLTYSADDNYDTGGANKYLYVYVHAKDANGIKSITVNLNSATIASTATTATVIATETITETDGTQGTKVYFGPIDMSAYTSANTPLTVTATDNFDLSTPSSRNILIDNDAPTVSMIYPLSTQRMSTGFSATGTVSDNAAGTGVKSIKWMIPTVAAKSGITVDSTGWNEIGTTAAWTIAFISSDIKTYGTSTYGTETTAGSGIYNVSLYFRVEDIAGNANVITTNTMRFDPDADKPVADVIYPATSDPLTNLGGTIRAYGTASDNVSVASVQMQMDVNGDGSFDETDYNLIKGWKTAGYTAYTGLSTSYTDASSWYFTVSGTTNWNIALNANKELDAYKSNTNGLGIRVRAYDDDSNTRAWSVIQRFKIDTDVPEFGSTIKIQLVRFNGTAIASTLDYSTGMWISDYENGTKNPWYLYGTVEDDSGITAIEFANQTGYGTLNYTLAANSGYFTAGYTTDGTSWTAGTPASGTTVVRKGYLLKVPLEMARANSDGAIKSIITIYDGTSPNPVKNTSNIQINIDNTAPAMEYTTAGNKATLQLKQGTDVIGTSHTVTNSNGSMFTFGDSVTENGSGFSRLVFYYERVPATTSATNPARVYNPMESSSNRTDLTYNIGSKESDGYYADGSFYINDDGLPVLIIKNGSNAVTRSNTTSLTATRLVNNKNVRIGGLVKIAGVYRRIDSVTTSTGTITFSPGVDTSYTTAEVVYGLVVDHLTTESLSGTTVINDDGDGMVEILSQTGGTYNWKASIDSQNIKDGSIQIHCVSFDAAGNCEHGYVTTSVQNNRPRLTKVFLGTDLSGNNTYDFAATTDETPTAGTEYGEFCYYPTTDTTDGVYTTTLASSAFIAKSGLAIVPEFVGSGDNGSLSYILTHNKNGTTAITSPATTSSGTLVALTTATSSITGTSASTAMTVTSKGYIPLTTADLINICTADGMDGSADKEMLQFSIWDQTEETTQGVDSQWAIINVPLIVDVVDKAAPYAHVHPFYWNNASDNSLYGNSAANGHIELEGDLSDSFSKTGTTVYDLDPKVSGKIRIVGDAYDETKLTKIELKIDDMALGGTAGAWTTLATYSPGAWTKNAAAGAMVSAFSVTDPTGPTQHGHKVTWELDVDTSKIANVAGADKVILVRATDGGANESAITSTTNTTSSIVYATNSEAFNGYYYSTAALANAAGTADVTLAAGITPIKGSADATYANVYAYQCATTPYYRVDVVPYITGIQTKIRTSSGLKDNNIRSASGKYSIIYNATGVANFITVNGFNLNPNAVRVVDSTTAVSNTVSAGSGISVSYAAGASPYTSFTATNAITKSGYLEVFTNSVRSLNNINNNDSVGSYTANVPKTVTDLQNMPNRECDANTTKNITLTDDRYIRMFDMKNTGTKNGYYPTMLMDGNNPVFGYVDANGCSDGTCTYISQSFQPQRRVFNGDTGAIISTEYLVGGINWDEMAMAKDTKGRYVQASVYNQNGGSMGLYYDKYASLYTGVQAGNYYGTDGTYYNNVAWQMGTGYYGYDGDWSQYANNNAITLDGLNYNGVLVDRYQGLKLIASGDSTTTAGAKIYMAYYDDKSSEIIFRNMLIGTSKTLGNRLYNGSGYTQYTNIADNTNSTNAATGRLSVTTSGSKYFDFGITSDFHVVFVYYDYNTGKLQLKYSNTQVLGTSPATAITWNNINVSLPAYVGQYVSMYIDTNNHIHIAAFDANDSNLRYIYLDSYNSTTYVDQTVDATGSVGNWTQVKVYNNVPYIAYYNATETGGRETIKLAYANAEVGSTSTGIDNNGYTTGAWEYMTIPSITPAQGGSLKFKQVNLGFTDKGLPVLGYLGTNIEFGKWLVE